MLYRRLRQTPPPTCLPPPLPTHPPQVVQQARQLVTAANGLTRALAHTVVDGLAEQVLTQILHDSNKCMRRARLVGVQPLGSVSCFEIVVDVRRKKIT
jgi:hypothetical protein